MAKSKGVKYNYDPGLGTDYSRSTKRVINKDGSFNVKRVGMKKLIYHSLLEMGNFRFYTYVVGAYFISNIVFAVAYYISGVQNLEGAIGHLQVHDITKAFFFSMQTFTTVGFGAIFPNDPTTNFIAGMEAMAGLLFFAIATGLVYARFSKPSARILFSNNILVAPYKKDQSALMFRIANRRPNVLMELQAKVILVMDIDTTEHVRRKYLGLDLELDNITFFPLSWTIVHPIDSDSPIFGYTHEELLKYNAEFLILIKGFDETFGQQVHIRYSYLADELVWGGKFIRSFHTDDRGEIIHDIDGVHNYEPAELPQDEEPHEAGESDASTVSS